TVALAEDRLDLDLQVNDALGRAAGLWAVATVGADRRHVTVSDLGVTIGSQAWHLASGAPAAKIAWSKEGISISSLPLVTGQSDEQKIDISGTWQQDGSGALRVAATHVFLDTLGGSFEAPPRYGGVLDLDATVRGTVQKPIVTGSVTIS